MVSPLLQESVEREELPVGWPWRFFLFSSLIAITAVVAYSGVAFGYIPFLKGQIDTQQANIDELGSVVSPKQQEEFIRFYSQLVNVQGILAGHAITSPLFGMLEVHTNIGVHYTVMETRIPERKVLLEGMATNYGVFAQQLQAFAIAPEVENMIVNDSNALDGKVRFRLSLTVKPSAFNQK